VAAAYDALDASNKDLAAAYDATIKGWAQILDLRDREAEGHTARITELTLRLAQALGVTEEELQQIRRGALLHDIGKMGIADRILLKPDPLTDEERNLMKKHPTYAYEMLSPIQYLRPALDIPYCHHERWDGSGYPRGLKGYEIPLAARIFAVVDEYDDLISQRSYRSAWTKEKALEHICDHRGSFFDPIIVDSFIEIMKG
jgi:putative nucleotidyltransferase with HDIG domain